MESPVADGSEGRCTECYESDILNDNKACIQCIFLNCE